MRCLSVRQPWASAIFELNKVIENRSVNTHYRGILLIHASLRVDKAFWGSEEFRKSRKIKEFRNSHLDNEFDLGAIIGAVELVKVIEDSNSIWACKGYKHWVLRNPVRFNEPVIATGRLGLWKPSEAQIRAVKRQL
jgi:hypothetical protein